MNILEKIEFDSEQMGKRFLAYTIISLAIYIAEGFLLTAGEISIHGMNIIILSIIIWTMLTFPILVIYCFLCATKTKKLFCDLFYLTYFLAIELFFYYIYNDDICTFLYVTRNVIFNSFAIYASELFYRNRLFKKS